VGRTLGACPAAGVGEEFFSLIPVSIQRTQTLYDDWSSEGRLILCCHLLEGTFCLRELILKQKDVFFDDRRSPLHKIMRSCNHLELLAGTYLADNRFFSQMERVTPKKLGVHP